MPSCAVAVCKNSDRNCAWKNVCFHCFPNDKKLKKLWFSKCKRKDRKSTIPRPNDRVCSDHFKHEDYKRDLEYELQKLPPRKKGFLKDNSVPSLNLCRAVNVETGFVDDVRSRPKLKQVNLNKCKHPNKISSSSYKLKTTREQTNKEMEVAVSSNQKLKISSEALKNEDIKIETDEEDFKLEIIEPKFENFEIKGLALETEDLKNIDQEFEDDTVNVNFKDEHVFTVDGIDGSSSLTDKNSEAELNFSDALVMQKTNEENEPAGELIACIEYENANIESGLERILLFKCKECYRTFNSVQRLDQHVKSFHNTFKCKECDCVFLTIHKLTYHLQSVHYVNQPFKCHACESSFPCKLYLQSHIRSSHPKEKTFKCNSCLCSYSLKKTLENHIMSVHKNEGLCSKCGGSLQLGFCICKSIPNSEIFQCHACDYSTTHQYNLTKHFQLIHNFSLELVRCSICLRAFSNQSVFETHKCVVFNQNRSVSQNKEKSKGMLSKKIEVPLPDNKFTCEKCDHSFAEKNDLIKHELMHERKCSECDRSFRNKSNLMRHINTFHMGGKTLKCQKCSFATRFSRSLKIHIRVTHEIQFEVFRCQQCLQAFSKERILAAHISSVHGK